MRIASSPRLLEVGREGKEAKLRDFVAEDIASRIAQDDIADGLIYTVLARAPDSPVVRALQAIAADIAKARIGVRALLLDADCVAEDRNRPSILEKSEIDCRLLIDPRFAAAHEQLVLGPAKLWLGDCMRRDPAKRDAFEIFHADDDAAARHARISFERLWAIAKPLRRQTAAAPDFVIASQKTVKTKNRPASRR